MSETLYRRLTPVSKDWGLDRGLPIDRYYIEKFLAENESAIRGRVLEFHDSRYATRYGVGKTNSVDVLSISAENRRASIVADISKQTNLPLEAFDCIICTQTLQYIYDCRAAIASLNAMLKRDGVLLATMPGITKTEFGEVNYSWAWNFTSPSAKRAFEECFPPENVQVRVFGNVLSSISFLHGFATQELTKEELDYRDAEYEVIIAVRADKR